MLPCLRTRHTKEMNIHVNKKLETFQWAFEDRTPFLTINDREINDRLMHLQLLNCAIWDVQETLQPERPPTAGCQ